MLSLTCSGQRHSGTLYEDEPRGQRSVAFPVFQLTSQWIRNPTDRQITTKKKNIYYTILQTVRIQNAKLCW